MTVGEAMEEKKDGRLVWTIGEDAMKASISVIPPVQGGSPVTREMALKILADAGVVFGIDHAQVEMAVRTADPDKKVVVAYGKPAVHGKDAQVSFNFALENAPLKPVQLNDGRVDYYNLNRIHSITAGQVLATKTPAAKGEPGCTVTGKQLLPNPGKDQRLRPGKNTVLSDDGLSLIATADGHVLFLDGKVNVFPIYVITGDVDFSTGNIEFIGSVQINGGIKTGFVVKADGDVEVRETIEGGIIVAGGSVVVKEGIRGLGKGRVIANGSVKAKFIENALVDAGEDIVVQEAILHSTVSAAGKVIVHGRKALLAGGLCRAGESIEAKIIGSSLATTTELEVGVNPDIRVAYNQTLAKRKEIEIEIEKVEKALRVLQSLSDKGDVLSPKNKALQIRLEQAQLQLEPKIQAVKDEENKLFRSISILNKGTIKVKNLIYPGITIRMGNSVYYVKDIMEHMLFFLEEGEIKASPLV